MNNPPNSTAQVLIEKLLVPQLVKRFSALKEPEGSLPCSQQPTSGYYQSSPRLTTAFLRYLIILPSHVRPSLPGFSSNKPACIYLLSIRATCLAHDILLNMITLCWRVQIRNLLITSFSPTSYCFLPLGLKYIHQHPILEHTRPMFFLSSCISQKTTSKIVV